MFNVGILFLMRSISLINSAEYNYDKHGTYSHKVYRMHFNTQNKNYGEGFRSKYGNWLYLDGNGL